MVEKVVCVTCEGSGDLRNDICPICNGVGKVAPKVKPVLRFNVRGQTYFRGALVSTRNNQRKR